MHSKIHLLGWVVFGLCWPVWSIPTPQDNVGVALFSPVVPTCGDPSTIPAGVEMKGVAGNTHEEYDPPVILSPIGAEGSQVRSGQSVTKGFMIQAGAKFDLGKIAGLGSLEVSFTLSSTTKSGDGSQESMSCDAGDCRLTFAAHTVTIYGGSYIDMDNSGTYDPNIDYGPDNDQSCHDRLFTAVAPIRFPATSALDGKYDVCYVDKALAGKPWCGDLGTTSNQNDQPQGAH